MATASGNIQISKSQTLSFFNAIAWYWLPEQFHLSSSICVCVHCQRDYCRLWLDLTPLPQTCFRYCRKPQCKSYYRYQEQLRSTGCYYGQRNSDEVCKAQFAKRILQQIELHFIYVCICIWNKKNKRCIPRTSSISFAGCYIWLINNNFVQENMGWGNLHLKYITTNWCLFSDQSYALSSELRTHV